MFVRFKKELDMTVQLNLGDSTSTYEVDGISDYHRFISQKKLAELLNVSSMTIYRWVKKGVLPAPLKFGTHKNASVRFDLAELARRGIFCDATKNVSIKSATIVDGEKKLLVVE